MNNIADQFREAICVAGLEPPEVIVPGKWHRFPGAGKGRGNRAAWCKLFDGGVGGCFGDWSSGVSKVWLAKHSKPYSQAKRASIIRQVEAAKRQAEVERRAHQAEAASRAVAIWRATTPASHGHPYLIRKHIGPHSARLHKGTLTLPVIAFNSGLTSLQFISRDGVKRLLTGGRKCGCFIPVAGDMTNPSCVIICEGWATGCTLAENQPAALVLAAIDAGNLEPVALAARQRWPSTELVIAGDDDRLTAGNPGASKAKAAAIASDALLALPPWPDDAPAHLTDFNDLADWVAGGAA